MYRIFSTYLLKFLFLTLLIVAIGCSSNRPDRWTDKQAPESFQVRLQTTEGDILLQSRREWSPQGVDRFYQLVRSGFYENIGVFRVIPGFVAQFGIHNDSSLNAYWKARKVPDEPVLKGNERGTVSFARAGQNTRSTQLFFNLVHNARLDTIHYDGVTGFPVIAEVIGGMEVVDALYAEYGAQPGTEQDSIQAKGNDYLKRKYPELDYIIKAEIVK